MASVAMKMDLGTKHLAATRIRLPGLIVSGAVVYLVVVLLASYAVDVRDAFGLRTRMLGLDMDHPALWYHLFSEGKLTEMLQWFTLAAVVVVAALLSGRIADEAPQDARFWGILAAGAALMLIEDAGNIRHTIAAYPADLAPAALERTVRVSVRLLVMAGIAAVPLYALLRYGRGPLRVAGVRGYLILGYAMYAIAAVGSATSGFIGYHDTIGVWIFEVVGRGEMVILEDRTVASFGSFLSDNVVEESMELLAASGLCAAAAAAFVRATNGDVAQTA